MIEMLHRQWFKSVAWVIGVVASGVLLSAIHFLSSWNQWIDHTEIDKIIEIIDQTDPVDDRLANMYNDVYEGALNKSAWQNLWDWLCGENRACPCITVARWNQSGKHHRILGNYFIVAVTIEKEVNQRACYDYIAANTEYLRGVKGAEEAAQFYYGSTIYELEVEELIGMIALQKSPTRYDPIRNPEQYEKKVDELRNLIQNKN